MASLKKMGNFEFQLKVMISLLMQVMLLVWRVKMFGMLKNLD